MSKEYLYLLLGISCWVVASLIGYAKPEPSGIEALIIVYLVLAAASVPVRNPNSVERKASWKAQVKKERLALYLACAFLGYGVAKFIDTYMIRDMVCTWQIQVSMALFYLNHVVRIHLANPVQPVSQGHITNHSRRTP